VRNTGEETTSPPRRVPFYSQRANWNGEDSGFPNQEAIDQWQHNCCGIACARMVIDFYTGNDSDWLVPFDHWERSFSGNYMEFRGR